MTPELWQRLKPLFHATLKIDPQNRAAFIEEVCGDDLELKMHLKQLIEAEEQGTQTIDAPLVELNGPVALGLLGMVGPTIAPDDPRYRIVAKLGGGGIGDCVQGGRRLARPFCRTQISSQSHGR